MLKKIKLFFLIVLAIFKRKWQLYTLGLILMLATAFFVFKLNPNFFRPNTLSEGIIGTYDERDLPDVTTVLLSKGLVKIDDHGYAAPDLASGWEVNNDATIFTFRLRPNLVWSDGSPVKSSDLEFGIPDVEESYPDGQTIQFKLKDSFSALPSILVKPAFKKGNTLLGVGPYKVVKIERSVIFITKIKLEAVSKDLPGITLRFYPNEKIALTAFSLGEVQSLIGVTNLNDFQNHPQVKTLQIKNYSKIVSILYNVGDPVLGNRSMRQTLRYGAHSVKGEI